MTKIPHLSSTLVLMVYSLTFFANPVISIISALIVIFLFKSSFRSHFGYFFLRRMNLKIFLNSLTVFFSIFCFFSTSFIFLLYIVFYLSFSSFTETYYSIAFFLPMLYFSPYFSIMHFVNALMHLSMLYDGQILFCIFFTLYFYLRIPLIFKLSN